MTLVTDDLRRLLDRHGGEWVEQVSCCGTCGRLFAGYANGSNCPHTACDGTLDRIGRFIDEERLNCPEPTVHTKSDWRT